MTATRRFTLALLAAIAFARPARADWLVTPFAAAAMRTQTSFLDLDDAARRTHTTFGVAVTAIGDGIFGVDAEAALTPSAFTGHDLVVSSRTIVVTGSALAAVPKRWSRVVRPYATLGGGIIRVHSEDIAAIFPIDDTIGVVSLAAGVWVPVGQRVNLRAAVRYLRTGSDGP